MFQAKPIARGLALAFGGLACAGVTIPALAQGVAAPQTLERVEVTGSLIKRAAGESALPITTLNIEELQKAGVTTAEQAVQYITENQSAIRSANSVGASNGGTSYADLRGLGPQRTLVLLNGQRVVNNPYEGRAVDLNTLPTVAIQRIEVLRDGASAIYGTDAIAGVINIITRKEYQGISVAADGKWPQGDGGDSYGANIVGGYGSLADQGWNVYAGFSYQQQKVLTAQQRDYARTGVIPSKGMAKSSGTTFPATWSQFDPVSGDLNATSNPALPNCDPPASFEDSGACRYNYAGYVDLVPKQELWSLLAKGSLALGKNNTLSLEYFRAESTLDTLIAATPLVGLTMTNANPFFPGGPAGTPAAAGLDPTQPVTVNWRTTTAGQRAQEIKNTTDRVLLNLEGNAAKWNYNAAAYYSATKQEQNFTDGYVNYDLIDAALQGNAGGVNLNPFGPQNAAGQSYLTTSKVLGTVQNIEGNLWGVNATASTELMMLPAGPLTLAIGADYRQEEVDFIVNYALTANAASSGLELSQSAKGDRDVWALMAEISIPVIKNLDVTVALRYDDYSDVGTNWSPKVSVRYQPIEALLLRASYNSGFRAPTLYDLHQPTQITNTANPYDDPLLCPGGVPNAALGGVQGRDCNQQFNYRYQGNENLDPETSDSWSVGFVLDVTREFSFGADYWNTIIKNQVLLLPNAEVFANPALNTPFYFVRCGTLPAAEAALIDVCNAANPNVLAYVNTPIDNYGDIKASGIDFNFQWRPAASSYGRFSLMFNATYILNYKQQLSKGGVYYNPLGQYSVELDFPIFRFQSVTALGWQYGPWSANMFHRLKSDYTDQNTTEEGGGFDNNKVGAYSVWDLTGTWAGVKGLTITAGVLNLFNETPPFSNQGSTFQVGYDPRFTSPLDRTYMLRVAYEFK